MRRWRRQGALNVSATAVLKVDTPAAQPDQARWNAVFAALLRREGQTFTNDPADHGGATKYGITLRLLAQCCKLDPKLIDTFDINRDGAISVLDIRGLNIAHAQDFYAREFWTSTGISQLPEPFDAAIFDQAVNDGVVAAVKLLQQAHNALAPAVIGGARSLQVDGQLGAVTRAEIDRVVNLGQGHALLLMLRTETAHRYIAIASADPSQRRFLGGWLTRAEELGDV